MCLERDIEYFSSSESIDNFQNEINLQWPIEYNRVNGFKLIVACNICFYPITFEENVVDEIRTENNISFGLVILIAKLFRKVNILQNNPLDQWETQVFCPKCGIILSFTNQFINNINERNFAKVIHYTSHGEQIVILQSYLLFRGSSEEAHSRFIQMNDI